MTCGIPFLSPVFALWFVLCSGSIWEQSCPHQCTCTVRGWEALKFDAKTISCENMSLSTIPENISSEVEALNLRMNAIGHAHDIALVELLHLRRLMLLDLSLNRFRVFRSTGGYLESVRHLNLSQNCIVNVESGTFRSFINLEVLILRSNRIGSIAPMAFELPRLKDLDLSDNKLAIVSSHFFTELSELRILNLAKNHFGRLTEAILTHMNDVDLIDLDDNKISRIEPEVFRYVRNIGELRLSDNHLHEIPQQAFESIPLVQKLVLCRNPFRSISTGSFKNVKVLRLVICFNKDLAVVEEGAFADMPKTKQVEITNNKNLHYFAVSAFVNMPYLETLEFSNNSVYSFSEGVIANTESVMKLNLQGNPLRCDCTLNWLQNTSYLFRADDVSCWKNSKKYQLSSLAQHFQSTCPPTILPVFPDQSAKLPSTSVSVHCIASGIPPPLLYWMANNKTIESNSKCRSRICAHRNVLNIRYLHPEDTGAYTCVAENDLGSDFRSFNLLVKDLNIKIVPVTITSTYVTLLWNATSGIANDYVIQYKNLENDVISNKTIYMGIKSHSYTLSGLLPGQTYTIWLGIQREQYVIRLSSVQVTTKDHGFLVMVGIHTNYVSIVLVASAAGLIVLTCVCVCGIRLYKWRSRQHNEMVLTDNMSQRCFAKSESATSDLAFMTYVNIADEAVLVANDDESYE